ncbi:MAG: PAS domain-containing protein, partial [Planctomycetaceae bacterium]|nr:PAS domain-containing protein [Planctomycetaceae bacterium]
MKALHALFRVAYWGCLSGALIVYPITRWEHPTSAGLVVPSVAPAGAVLFLLLSSLAPRFALLLVLGVVEGYGYLQSGREPVLAMSYAVLISLEAWFGGVIAQKLIPGSRNGQSDRKRLGISTTAFFVAWALTLLISGTLHGFEATNTISFSGTANWGIAAGVTSLILVLVIALSAFPRSPKWGQFRLIGESGIVGYVSLFALCLCTMLKPMWQQGMIDHSAILFVMVLLGCYGIYLNLDRILAERANLASFVKSREQNQELARSARAFFWKWDAWGNFEEVSELAPEVLQVPENELVGKSLVEFVPEDARPRLIHWLKKLCERPQSFEKENCLCELQDGKRIWLMFSGGPRFDEAEELAGFQGTAIDVTERQAAAARLQRAVRGAE